MKKKNLNPVDIELYLSGALPARRRMLMKVLMIMDGDLRAAVEEARHQRRQFEGAEMNRLREKLFPLGTPGRAVPPGRQAGRSGSGWIPASAGMTRLGKRSLFGRPVIAFAGAALVLFFSIIILYTPTGKDDPVFYAKGKALGVHVYLKSGTVERVEDYHGVFSLKDTVLIVPMKGADQYFAIYGWTLDEGLFQVFPYGGGDMKKATAKEILPPLVMDSGEDHVLICITSMGQHPLDSLEKKLKSEILTREGDALITPILADDIYIQTWLLTREND